MKRRREPSPTEIDAELWRVAALGKELYWRDWKRRHGPAGGIRIADELRRQVIAQRPDWPTEEDRRRDAAAHIRLARLLERVPARPCRRAR
jgi:hypothetical protein